MPVDSGLRTLEHVLRDVLHPINIQLDPFNFEDLHPGKFRGNQEVANTHIRAGTHAVKLHIENNERGNLRISLRSRRDAAHVICVPAYALDKPREWFPDMLAAQNDRALHAELSRYDGDLARDRLAMVMHVFTRAILPNFPAEALQPSMKWTASKFPSRTAHHSPAQQQAGPKTATL